MSLADQVGCSGAIGFVEKHLWRIIMKKYLIGTIFFLTNMIQLNAQDINYGIQISSASTLGGMKNDKIAGTNQLPSETLGIGVNLNYKIYNFDDIGVVANSIGISGEYSDIDTLNKIKNEYHILQVGLQWRHYFNTRSQGLNAGLSINTNILHRDYTIKNSTQFGGSLGNTSRINQEGQIGLTVFGQYQFNSILGIFCSIHRVRIGQEINQPHSLSNAQWFQIGINFNFNNK